MKKERKMGSKTNNAEYLIKDNTKNQHIGFETSLAFWTVEGDFDFKKGRYSHKKLNLPRIK